MLAGTKRDMATASTNIKTTGAHHPVSCRKWLRDWGVTRFFRGVNWKRQTAPARKMTRNRNFPRGFTVIVLF